MAVYVTHLRSYCHVCCLLLTFSHAIGLRVSRDVNKDLSAATARNHKPLPPPITSRTTALPSPTLFYDVTQNAVLRPTAAIDNVIENEVKATHRPRRRRKAEIHYRSVVGDNLNKPEIAWNRELAERTLRELEQELAAARANCSATSGIAVQSLNTELPVRVLRRFSAEAASAVHAANVLSLLLQSPAEVTSHGVAFYFSFARAMVESAGDWVSSATLVVDRPGQTTTGPRAARFSPNSRVPELLRIRVSDAGRAEWYTGLLQRSRGRLGKGGRCAQDSWTTRNGDVVNKSTVVSELADVLWSVPYVICPSRAQSSLIVPIYVCGQHHSVVIRSASSPVSIQKQSLALRALRLDGNWAKRASSSQ